MQEEQEQQQFARALANPLKSVRDKTINELKKYLLSVGDMSDIDMLKLWKALFYCLWLADKAPVQDELCNSLASLLDVFKKKTFAFNKYLRMFFRTIVREWQNLDQYRLNKFYTLVRCMVNKAFVLLHESKWDKKELAVFVDVVSTEVLQTPRNGPRFHLCDVYLSELLDVAGRSISSTDFVKVIEPFAVAMCTTEDTVFHNRVRQRLFNDYCEQFAREVSSSAEESQDDAPTVFAQVSSVRLQQVVFELASGENCLDRHRKRVYEIHSNFQRLTKVVDAGDEAVARDLGEGSGESERAKANKAKESSSSSSSKKQKKQKQKEENSAPTPVAAAAPAVVVREEEKAPKVVATPKKANAPPQAPAKFVGSPKFAGAKDGYAFKKGPKGIGYYLDKHSKAKPAVATPHHAPPADEVELLHQHKIEHDGHKVHDEEAPVSEKKKKKKKRTSEVVEDPLEAAGDQNGSTSAKKSKKKARIVEPEADSLSSPRRVRFGKPQAIDYRKSVEGLRAAVPDLTSTPSKGAIKKATTRSATKASKGTPGR